MEQAERQRDSIDSAETALMPQPQLKLDSHSSQIATESLLPVSDPALSSTAVKDETAIGLALYTSSTLFNSGMSLFAKLIGERRKDRKLTDSFREL